MHRLLKKTTSSTALTTLLILQLIVLAGCTAATPQPGRIVTEQLNDGREISYYIPGYSIEDFLCEFDGIARCRNQ